MSTPNLNGSGNVCLPTFPALAGGAIFIKGFANNSTSVATAAQYVTFGHAFQKGQLAAGGGLQVAISGTTYPCQVDVKTSYADGSVCLCAISHQVPGIAFGSSPTVVWGQYSPASPPGGAPLSLSTALASTTCSITLTPPASFPNWAASTSYGSTSLIKPTANNAGGYVFQTNAPFGANYTETVTSGTFEPIWLQTEGDLVQAVTWYNIGTPSGTYADWAAQTEYANGATIKPTVGNAGGCVFEATTAGGGQSGVTEPTWPQATGNTVVDGPGGASGLTWLNIGKPISSAVSQDLVALAKSSTDLWLNGPLAVQGRGVATVAGTQMRFQVDVTAYADGTVNFDVLVGNDTMTYLASGVGYWGGTQAYTATITLNGSTAYASPALVHNLYENWTWQVGTVPHVVNSSQEMVLQVIHNPGDFIEAQAVLGYNYTLGAAYGPGTNYMPYGMANFVLADSGFGVPFKNPYGLVTDYMGNTGGRIDIGPNDAWNVWGFVTQDPTLQRVSFECCRVGGGINWHYWMAAPPASGAPANRYVTVLDYPGICVFGGAGDAYSGGASVTNTNPPGYGPAGVLVQTADVQWGLDVNHHPEMFYIPYLQTARRYLLDELNAVASWVVMATPVPASYSGMGRHGALGFIEFNYQIRGVAWALRALLLASYANPDGSWWKTYNRTILDNNYYLFNSLIGFLQKIGGDLYGYYAVGYGNAIPMWENGYMGTAVMLAAIMGYAPAIHRTEFMGAAIVGIMANGSDSPASGMPPAEAAAYDLIAWPYWNILGPYTGAANYTAWGTCWMYSPPQSWEAFEQAVQQGRVATGPAPTLQSNIVNAVFSASISGNTMTVSSVTAGTVAIGQYVRTTDANTNSTDYAQLIVSGSGTTWTLSSTHYSGYNGTCSGSFCDGLRIGPGILWNAAGGSGGAFGDYAQLEDYGLASLETMGYPGAAAARTTLYALTDSTGAPVPVITDSQAWAGQGSSGIGPSALYQIVPRTWNDSRVFDGAAGGPANPAGYSFAIMDGVLPGAPAAPDSPVVWVSRPRRVYFGNRR